MLDPARVGFTCKFEGKDLNKKQNELYQLTLQDKCSKFECGYKSVPYHNFPRVNVQLIAWEPLSQFKFIQFTFLCNINRSY